AKRLRERYVAVREPGSGRRRLVRVLHAEDVARLGHDAKLVLHVTWLRGQLQNIGQVRMTFVTNDLVHAFSSRARRALMSLAAGLGGVLPLAQRLRELLGVLVDCIHERPMTLLSLVLGVRQALTPDDQESMNPLSMWREHQI